MFIVSLIAALLAISAGNIGPVIVDSPEPPAEVASVESELSTAEILENQPLRLEAYPDETSIAFSDGSYEGYDGCNSLGGSTAIEGDRITFSNPVSTLALCLPEHVQANQAFHDMITGTRTVSWVDGRIVLSADDGQSWALIPQSDLMPESEDSM